MPKAANITHTPVTSPAQLWEVASAMRSNRPLFSQIVPINKAGSASTRNGVFSSALPTTNSEAPRTIAM